MNKRSRFQGLAVFLVSLCLFFTLFFLLFPWASQGQRSRTSPVSSQPALPKLNYVAIGDSLTLGVGDSNDNGGFVTLLAQALFQENQQEVISQNFGVSGNTSQQILKRMQEDEAIQKALEAADLMTLTVGGNDLMRVIQGNLEDLTMETFEAPAQSYAKRLAAIIELARNYQPELPIYVLGIYNPFYSAFSDISSMQTIVDNWNQTTEAILATYEGVYFVPISERMNRSFATDSAVNRSARVISDVDNFHPNRTGYQLILSAFMEKINETKDQWP